MKKVIATVLLLLLGAFLARTNPGEDVFRAFVQERVEDRLAQEAGGGGLGRILTDMGSNVAGSIAARSAERTDALLLSVYSIDLGADDNPDDKWLFLGIAGEFFELRRPRMLQRD